MAPDPPASSGDAEQGREPPPGADPGGGQPVDEGSATDERLAAPAPHTPLTHAQLERVIRRASDLQFRASSSVAETLDASEVIRIGEEVGLEPRYVRQAVAEIQAEALVPQAQEDRGLGRRLGGSAIVRASRVVPGSRDEVERNLERYLKERELLKPVRSRTGRSLWEPAGGLLSSMRRVMDVGGHGYVLASAKRIQVAIEALEPGWSLVTLTADASNQRNEALAGGMTGLGLAGIGTATGLIVATGGAALAIVGGVTLFTGGLSLGVVVGRRQTRKKRQQLELALHGVLDRLERGETLEPGGEPWHQRLLK